MGMIMWFVPCAKYRNSFVSMSPINRMGMELHNNNNAQQLFTHFDKVLFFGTYT